MKLQKIKSSLSGVVLALAVVIVFTMLHATANASTPSRGLRFTCKNNANNTGCVIPGRRCTNLQRLPSTCTWAVCPGCGQRNCYCP